MKKDEVSAAPMASENPNGNKSKEKSPLIFLAPVFFVILLIISAIVFGIENLLQFVGIK